MGTPPASFHQDGFQSLRGGVWETLIMPVVKTCQCDLQDLQKKRGCSLGAPSLGNFENFVVATWNLATINRQKGNSFQEQNCIRKEFGHLTSPVPLEPVCISHAFARNDLDTFYSCSRQNLGHGHTQLWIKLLIMKLCLIRGYFCLFVWPMLALLRSSWAAFCSKLHA